MAQSLTKKLNEVEEIAVIRCFWQAEGHIGPLITRIKHLYGIIYLLRLAFGSGLTNG